MRRAPPSGMPVVAALRAPPGAPTSGMPVVAALRAPPALRRPECRWGRRYGRRIAQRARLGEPLVRGSIGSQRATTAAGRLGSARSPADRASCHWGRHSAPPPGPGDDNARGAGIPHHHPAPATTTPEGPAFRNGAGRGARCRARGGGANGRAGILEPRPAPSPGPTDRRGGATLSQTRPRCRSHLPRGRPIRRVIDTPAASTSRDVPGGRAGALGSLQKVAVAPAVRAPGQRARRHGRRRSRRGTA
jgi:hypothetical protein